MEKYQYFVLEKKYEYYKNLYKKFLIFEYEFEEKTYLSVALKC